MADVNTLIYFEDKKGSKGLTIYPRELSITWGNDKRYWKWFGILLESQDFKVAEIPKLLDVCWLDIKGKFDMSRLTAGIKYEVGFIVMLKEPVSGWQNNPVTLRLDLPDETSQSRNIDLSNVPRNEWKTLVIGEFTASKVAGDVLFSMKEIKKGYWKKGVIIKSVVVRPVYN
uniref:Phloem protein 2 n=1 Tax=Lycoris aurea TaxID=152838 RepID=A0A2Q6_LYCAU|nr:phloem protein 2 [Lycoris aurea]